MDDRSPYLGSTSDFRRVSEGVVVKAPMALHEKADNPDARIAENRRALEIERQILKVLGSHPRIVPYIGKCGLGILLQEARLGSLQAYINSHHAGANPYQLSQLCTQAAEAIAHIHSRGVIHSDLRPENFLVDQMDETHVKLWLCDFGGSWCDIPRLEGHHLPDPPFMDPRLHFAIEPATDIFSLGSIFYTIQTGHWPYMEGPQEWESWEHKFAYEEHTLAQIRAEVFPDISNLGWGDIIEGCWSHRYKTAEELLNAIRLCGL